MEHDILGETIKNTRLHKGISQERLAEMLNCSPRHIMGIENEGKKPGYGSFITLYAHLIFLPTQFFILNVMNWHPKRNLLSMSLSVCSTCAMNAP